MKILFIGDVVGRVGRRIVKEKLSFYCDKYDIDFVICNGENATHGKGLIENQYHELVDAGVDCVTLGNHYDSKGEIKNYLERVDRLVRPLNLLHEYPGEGSIIYDLGGVSVRVTNLLGSSFMKEDVNSPYSSMLELLENEEQADIHIVDFHAEATGEKMCLALALNGKVSAVLGTHTHVQTKDARILSEGTAFISDVGMCGLYDGVLGFEKDSVVGKMIYGRDTKFNTPDDGKGIFSAVVLDVDETNGKTKDMFSIYEIEK